LLDTTSASLQAPRLNATASPRRAVTIRRFT
jgi:hypothetical protein